MKPARDASRMAQPHLAREGGPALALDGPARRRQRPADATQPTAHYSGKKKPQTAQHLLLVHAHTGQVVSLSLTAAGHLHAKKRADEAALGGSGHMTVDTFGKRGLPTFLPRK